MYAKLFDARLKEKINKLIKEKFGKSEFVCPDLPKGEQEDLSTAR